MMLFMILCWILWTKTIIGLTLPIIATILCGLEIIFYGIKYGMKIQKLTEE